MILFLIIFLLIILIVINIGFNYDNFFNVNNNYNNNNDFVFIMTRHVNSETTNKYWIESYKCIRKIYPEIKLIIIDDNSNYNFINYDIDLINVEIIQSEYPGRGELLPYYYFYKNKYAKKAVIIHDSIFFMNKIDFANNDKVKFLWHHHHNWNNTTGEKNIILNLNNSNKLLELYENKQKWVLCFGVMSAINYDFLKNIEEKYNFFNLLNVIKTRQDRMCLERIFGLLCHAEYPELINDSSIFNVQHRYNYSFNNYLHDLNINNINLPIIKVWTGR